MSAWPSPEVTPALDEKPRPVIGPNLAGNIDLCRRVLSHVWKDFGYPYMLQQTLLWPTWDRLYDAWRVKGKRSDLDISYTDPASEQKNPDGRGDGLTGKDGISAKVYPSAFHRQVRNKTDMHMSVAWDGGVPVRAVKPETIYEHPLYNPDTQQVNVANELLHQCADQIEMKSRDRIARGSWSLYGHAYIQTDFKYRLIPQAVTHQLPPDTNMAQMRVQAVSAQMGGQQPQFDPQARTATWWQLIVDPDSMVTDYLPIRHDCVLLDQTLSASDMDRQPCPFVRSHGTRFDLWGNDYDPQQNPFGWLNVQQALSKGAQQYTLSAQDEGSFRLDLAKKYGLSDAGQLKPRNAMKQLWTCYPMLAIDPATGMLDEGEGIECPTCRGAKQVAAQTMVGGEAAQYSTMPDVMGPVIIGPGGPAPALMQAKQDCPDCQGVGLKFIEPKRYVMQMYGLLSFGGESSATVLRIQPIPTVGGKVPLLFGAHLTEDTAGAIPYCWAEAALPATDQLATAHNQFLDAKNQVINRQWLCLEDEPARNMDLNRPNKNIPVQTIGGVQPAPSIAFDITQTLQPYMGMQEGEIQSCGGLPPVALGQIASGRRAATEIQTASDAAQLPITVEIDSYNTQLPGRWAKQHLDNIEAYGDRDWIFKRTGRTTFGRVKLYTQVAKDFFTEQAQLQLLQNFLPAAAGIPGFNVARAAQEIFTLAGFNNASEFIDDGGVRKAQMDAFRIIAEFLGEGKFSPPTPFDPHQIYIECFQQALMDPDWLKKAPEMMPMLEQRLNFQNMLFQQQQQQQMMQQAQQAALMAGAQAQGSGRGPNAAKGSQIAGNATQARQQQAGRNAPQ